MAAFVPIHSFVCQIAAENVSKLSILRGGLFSAARQIKKGIKKAQQPLASNAGKELETVARSFNVGSVAAMLSEVDAELLTAEAVLASVTEGRAQDVTKGRAQDDFQSRSTHLESLSIIGSLSEQQQCLGFESSDLSDEQTAKKMMCEHARDDGNMNSQRHDEQRRNQMEKLAKQLEDRKRQRAQTADSDQSDP